jgi:hypothetical protein
MIEPAFVRCGHWILLLILILLVIFFLILIFLLILLFFGLLSGNITSESKIDAALDYSWRRHLGAGRCRNVERLG